MFTNKKREGLNTFVCAVSLYVAETPKASIKEHEPPLPIEPFGIAAYGFVAQHFSKQLYISPRGKHFMTFSFTFSRICFLDNEMHPSVAWFVFVSYGKFSSIFQDFSFDGPRLVFNYEVSYI